MSEKKLYCQTPESNTNQTNKTNKEDKAKKYYEVALGVILGGVTSSRVDYDIITFHGSYAPEPLIALFIAILVFYSKSFLTAIKSVCFNKLILFAIALIIFNSLICLISSDSENKTLVYSDIRAQIALILSFSFIYKMRKRAFPMDNFILGFCLSTIILDLSGDFIIPSLVYGKTAGRTAMGFIACIILGIYSIRTKSIFFFVASLVSSVLMVYLGILRQHYLAIIAIYLLGFVLIYKLFITKKAIKGIILLIVFLLLPIISTLYVAPIFINHLQSSEHLRLHGIERVTNLLESLKNGNLNSDIERIESFRFIIDKPISLLAPHGLGWRVNGIKEITHFFDGYNINSTADNAYLYVAYHFGLVEAIVILSIIGAMAISKLGHRVLFLDVDEFLILTIVILILLATMTVSSELLIAFNKSIQMGILLSYSVPINKKL
jgi:hypothetical protein